MPRPLYVDGTSRVNQGTMKHRTLWVSVLALILAGVPTLAQQTILTVCAYEPPVSRISDLSARGSFNWYDGPYADDRNRAIAASLSADYGGLLSSEASAQQIDAHGEVRGGNAGWTLDLSGAGSLRAFLDGDLFGVGEIGIDASNETGLEVDLTAGVGKGRFRDVTPLAKAIRIQNGLLDLGELLAPVSNATLLAVAQILGTSGPTDDEKLVRVAERLLATELIRDEELDVRGLLEIEEVLAARDVARFCGSDIQARIGASAMLLPKWSLAATGILLVRYAVVPDPVTQIESNAEAKIRLARPEEMNLNADLSYARRLPDGWTARAEYRLRVDRMWTDRSATLLSHALSASLTTQILGGVGLSLVADAQYQTGDEEPTLSLAVHLEADLF